MLKGEDYNYAIIRINHRTNVALTVDIVNGQLASAAVIERRLGELTESEKKAGWSFRAERTTRRAWSKPIGNWVPKTRTDKCA